MTATIPAPPATDDVLIANDLVRTFRVRVNGARREVRAVDGVSLRLRRGGCLGLVGESGCGKTTTGRMLVGLDQPTSGDVRLDGERIWRARGRVTPAARRDVQMIFQDPQSSLDPRMTAAQSIAEPLQVSGRRRAEVTGRVAELLTLVGLDAELGGRHPSKLSGGQRQRVGIARALALDPAVIIADEPTSALDVSVRAQVINLLKDLQQRLQLSLVFISHDLSMVRYLCDSVAVMYLGKIVEQGPAAEVFDRPEHPYTRALLESVPVADPVAEAARPPALIGGEAATGADTGRGCAFEPRCPIGIDRCGSEAPLLISRPGDRLVACHLAGASGSVDRAGSADRAR